MIDERFVNQHRLSRSGFSSILAFLPIRRDDHATPHPHIHSVVLFRSCHQP